MGAMGNAALRQRAATAGHGNGTRRGSGKVPEYKGWVSLQRELGFTRRSVVTEKYPHGKMLTKDQAGDIFNSIRKYSTAGEVEALFYGGKSALTRFANNTIHQNVAEENYGVSVRAAFGGRTARATTNKFDKESLKRVAQASEGLAKL